MIAKTTDCLIQRSGNPFIPGRAGIYALGLNLAHSQNLLVGGLGEIFFPAGDYIYVGSAQGSGGLRARLGRHLRGDGRTHWHIDYLRSITTVLGYCFAVTREHLECTWIQALIASPQVSIPATGFGSSDCKSNGSDCASHLVLFQRGINSKKLQEFLSAEIGISPDMVGLATFSAKVPANI